MSQEQPSEEEIFDYFLGETSSKRTDEIRMYLSNHPHEEKRLKEWLFLEQSFEKTPLQKPAPHISNRVRYFARQQVHHQSTTQEISFSSWIKSLFSHNKTVFASVFVLVITLSLLLFNQVPKSPNDPTQIYATKTQNTKNSLTTETPALANEVDSLVLENYQEALVAFDSGDYKKTHDIFSKITSLHPNFTQKQELYTYWVEALKHMGKYKLAEKKQRVLEEFKAQKTK